MLKKTVIALYEQLLGEFGGSALLHSALARPRIFTPTQLRGRAGGSCAFRLVKNHPFVDGNRAHRPCRGRAQLNDLRFSEGEVDAVMKTFELAAGEIDERGYAAWLEANMHERGRRLRTLRRGGRCRRGEHTEADER